MDCILCGEKNLNQGQTEAVNTDSWEVLCPRCGRYQLTRAAQESGPLDQLREKLYLVSGLSRNRYEYGGEKLLVDRILFDERLFAERIEAFVPNGIRAKSDAILRYLQYRTEHPGYFHQFAFAKDYPIAFCKKPAEMAYYINYLEEAGLVERKGREAASLALLNLTVKGWDYLAGLRQEQEGSSQAFVAMWFDDSMSDMFMQGIKQIEDVTGYRVFRVDKYQFNEKICDRILAEVRRSRFMIADVTGHRTGVYFEAGFAMGLGIPVIWTCREDYFDDKHFDTRQYNHIVWSNPAELKIKLIDRVLATIGKNINVEE